VSTAISNLLAPLRKPLDRRQSILLVFCCTFIGAAAQIFMKLGANRLPPVTVATLTADIPLLIRDFPLIAGLSLYGVFTVLLILALRDGELSILYPVIALNYVWVTMLSLIFFGETMNPYKAIGIATIVLGVVVLGRGGGR
jgi:multidrug transporter EmrE-like cation transporter